jgi:YVTN family beta-propeller protein
VINTANNTVSTTIAVGTNPYGISVSPDGSKVYVVNGNSNTVSVINTATNTVTATITGFNRPYGISVSPNGSKIYVANVLSNTVSVIDSVTNIITATITVGTEPNGISVSPDGSKVYVANQFSNTVSVINTATNTVSNTIAVGNGPITFGNFISIYPSHLGIAPQSMVEAGIEVYPNPATNTISIDIPQAAGGSKQEAVGNIEIYNLLGEKVYQSLVNSHSLPGISPTTNAPMTNVQMTINVADFPSGVYVMQVRTENGIEVRKFVKE